MLCSEKHHHEGKSQGQVSTKASLLRGQRNFEWNMDLIETKKLENYTCQVAQDRGTTSGDQSVL